MFLSECEGHTFLRNSIRSKLKGWIRQDITEFTKYSHTVFRGFCVDLFALASTQQGNDSTGWYKMEIETFSFR